MTFGAGGGVLVWKAVDPRKGTIWEIRSDRDEPTDFDATELLFTASIKESRKIIFVTLPNVIRVRIRA